MPARSAPLELEALLEHADWLRRLARALVSDDLVDDVVQETWVASLRQPPRQEHAIRAWLRRVAGNVVRTRFRSERRRHAREALVSLLDQPVLSPGETAERSETSRLLADHLAGLREPYRQVILLRYYDGLSSADISRRLGLPAGTVRRRLKVGLDRLRGSLEERPDRAPAWLWRWAGAAAGAAALSAALVVVRAPPSAAGVAPAPAATIEGVVSGADDRPVAGAVVTLSSLSTHRPVADLRTGPDGSFRFARLRADRYALSASSEDGWATREPLAVDGAGLRADLTVEGAVVALAGAVGDRDGEPVPGATVTAWEDRTDWLLDRVYQVPVDEDGHYRLLLPPGRYRVRALAPGHARSIAYPQLAGNRDLDFALDPLVRVEGRLTERSGQPVAGARVSWESSGGRVQSITADADGRFRAAVEPDVESLWARRGELYGSAAIGALRPGAAPVIMARGRGVHGRILAPDGQPLGGVEVIARDPQPWHTELLGVVASARSDAAGHYRLDALPPGPLALEARGPGRAPVTASAGAGDATVDLSMPAGVVVIGRVLLAGGGPAAGALVMAGLDAPGSEPYRHLLTDAAGAFRLEGLPAGRVRLLVQSGRQVGASTVEAATGGRHTVALTLAPAVWLSGRLTRPDGSPAPAAPVEAATGLPTAGFGFYAAGVSDARGRFRLGPFAPGPVSVSAGWGGLPATGGDRSARTLELRPGQDGALVLTAAGGSDR